MKDKEYNDIIRKLREQKPVLKNKETLHAKVMGQIQTDARRHSIFNKQITGWIRVAASILLFVGIANLAWQELAIQNKRMALLSQANMEPIATVPEMECQESLVVLLENMREEAPDFKMDGRTIYLTLDDLIYLKNNNSTFFPEVQRFLSALKKLYPEKYDAFIANGELKLSVWQLKHDHRLCQWFN